MRITQRQVAIGLQSMFVVSLVLIMLFQIGLGSPGVALVLNALAIVTASVVLAALLRGWRYAPLAIVISSALFSGSVPPMPVFSVGALLSLLIPPLAALIFGRPAWVWLSALATLAIFIFRTGLAGLPDAPAFYILYVLIVGGMTLARLVTEQALAAAQAQERRSEVARAELERQSRDLAAANARMEAQIQQQSQLLELVATLEAPASQLADGVLFAPIVGALDSRRAQALTSRLLREVSEQRAQLVILDIAGVPAIDAGVAQALLNTAQALRLLGCRVALSGISAAVAMTLVNLDIGLADLTTVRSPQEALAAFAAP